MPGPRDLEKLKADYKKLQDDIAGLQGKAAATQASIKTAEAQLAEIVKATDGYDKSGPDMQRELDGDAKVIGTKRSIAESEIKQLKDPIDKTMLDFGNALDERAKVAAAAADTATKARDAVHQAMQDLQDTQSAFAVLKNQPKAAAARLKELRALIDEIAKAEAQNDPVAMYFYVGEAAALAKGISVPASDDYRKQLVAAQSGIENVEAAAAAKKADSDKAATAASNAQKAYDAALAARRADLLKVLRDVKAPALT
jgi:DNA repair exonuclease SbcCD ATPase subunit